MVPDLICFSHLRWDFVFQRPQHLMERAARARRVVYVEEPMPGSGPPRLDWRTSHGVEVVTPHVPPDLSERHLLDTLRRMVDSLVDRDGPAPVLWYLTPMALEWSDHLEASARVYDCMDELSAFREASPRLRHLEDRLFRLADVVFTGGAQLYASKRRRHPNVHLFPSSVDVEHFARARADAPDPADQASIPRPRLGWFGVIDERLDLPLIAAVASARPAWQLVLVGPVAKIDPSDIPVAPNIHVLGMKPYAELPAYLAGWDVGIMPFARNEATRYISPTKTPEYLAGGRPIASTSIRDVVEPYGRLGLAQIGDGVWGFIGAVERALAEEPETRIARADAFLAKTSWDLTWTGMERLVSQVVERRRARARATATGGRAPQPDPTSPRPNAPSRAPRPAWQPIAVRSRGR